MARKFLCVYYDQEESWNQLSDGERGRLLSALISYAKRGEEPNLTGAERSAWAFLKVQVDADIGSHDARIQQCREAGKASAAKRNERQRMSTDVNERQRTSTDVANNNIYRENSNNNNLDNLEEKEKENTKRKRKTGGGFVPPTRDEVREYVKSRNSHVDPDQFFDYFSEGNWHDSKGNPVRNWKQKLLTWEKFQAKDKKQDEDDKPDLSWFYNA